MKSVNLINKRRVFNELLTLLAKMKRMKTPGFLAKQKTGRSDYFESDMFGLTICLHFEAGKN